MAKKQVAYRLSDDTITELDNIARRHKVTQTDVIIVLAHMYDTMRSGLDDDAQNQIDSWFEIIRRS